MHAYIRIRAGIAGYAGIHCRSAPGNKSRRSEHGRAAGVQLGGGGGGSEGPAWWWRQRSSPAEGCARCHHLGTRRRGQQEELAGPVAGERERARGGEDGSAEERSRSEPHVRDTEKIMCLRVLKHPCGV
jgi:hypothetical protein